MFTEIVNQEDPKNRVNTLKHFISVVNHLMTLNNFNGCMEIIAGLGNSAVNRMKKTWHV